MKGNSCQTFRTPTASQFSIFLVVVSSVFWQACGGGSGSQSTGPGSPAFTVSINPAAPSIAPGTSATVLVSVVPENGFNGSVSVTVSGLPSGLSAMPSSFTLQSSPQSLTLTATNLLATGTYSLTIAGTSGDLNQSTRVNVTVAQLQAFTLIQPAVLEVVTRFGSTASANLRTAVPPGPANYTIAFSVEGLPTGVTGSFSPNPITPGQSTTLNLSASNNTPWIQNLPIGVVATPSAAVPGQSLGLDLVVSPPPGSIPNNRSDYLRTDDTPQSIVYDAAHQLIFSSDFMLNRVDVVSTTTRQIVRSVQVLSPVGMALTLNGSEVLVGGDAQQITAISTTTLQISQVWKLPRISAGTYAPRQLYPLSNGKVALLTGVGVSPIAIWNPTTNKVSTFTVPSNVLAACLAAGSTDGTKLIVANCSDAGGAAIYDTATNQFDASINIGNFIDRLVAAPDGSRFAMLDETNGLVLYNNQFQPIADLIPFSDITGFIFSSDGTRFYAVGDFGVPLVATFDASTGAFLSTAPAIGTIPPGEQIGPSPFAETPMAIDSTGIIFGSADHGIAFDDSTYSVNYILGFNATPAFDQTLSPNFGPVDSATPVSFPEGEGFGFLPDVWFGSLRGTEAALNEVGVLSVNAPASSHPGPVNVKVIEPDGTPIFNPLAFSYGPTLMFVNGDTASPTGGATSHLVGVGLPTDPTQIQVTIANRSATVLSASKVQFESVFFPFGYPYPAVDVTIILPPGSGDADVQITTPAGSATLTNAIHYVQSVTDYASADSFQSIVLDRARNQLYLSAGNHIDVFSLTAKQFLSPILPPVLNGQKGFHGLAMTPDGAKLLAANFPDGSVAIINLNQPSSAQVVQIIPPGTFSSPGPENVVTTNTGKAFIESLTTQEAGCGGTLYELDLSTLQVTTITEIPFFCVQPEGFPMAASADGSKVLLTSTDISGDQGVAVYDAAANTWSTNDQVLENFGGNAALSANGSVFATGSGMVDANANLLGYLSYWEVFDFRLGFALPLEKVSDGGSLVYIPYQNNIDIFDVNHGTMLSRLTLVEQVQHVTSATALDQYGQNLYLLTNAGLTAVQFATAPLAIGSVSPASGPSGTSITILGSGFQPGMSATANGSPMATTFVDSNTLQAVLPSVATGAIQISVSDLAGHSYSLDDAFTAQ